MFTSNLHPARLAEIAEAQTFRTEILQRLAAQIRVDGGLAEVQPIDTGALFYFGSEGFLNLGNAIGIQQADAQHTVADEAAHVADTLAFYQDRKVQPRIEVSISARPTFLAALAEAGFHPSDPANVLSLNLADWTVGQHQGHPAYSVEQASKYVFTSDYVLDRVLEGYGIAQTEVHRAFYHNWFLTESQTIWIAFDTDSEPVAVGSCLDINGLSYLSGATVLPRARGLGIHTALLHQRLDYLAAIGSKRVIFVATPASVSEANALKLGFGVIDTRFRYVKGQ